MKMETQWERHCLSGILLMMIAIAIAIAMFTNTRMVYAETETGNDITIRRRVIRW